jgi:hypothetical protein
MEDPRGMLLHRVITHFRKQEWTAIGIDFVIVVVGVFIGIQVSNWNDQRLRSETARTYIERIREDLRANLDDFDQRLAYFGQVRTNAMGALGALDRPKDMLGEQFLIDTYQASQMLARRLGRDTYDEILSVGANDAIADVSVRNRLANFYRSIEAQLVLLQPEMQYRKAVRAYMPYAVQAAIRSTCNDITDTGEAGEPIISLPASCDPDLTSEEVSEAVEAILDLDIRHDLTRRITDLDLKLWALQQMIDRATLLDAYLENPNRTT